MDRCGIFLHYCGMKDARNGFRINSFARHVCPPDWSWDTRNAGWRDYDLWVVLDGRGVLASDDARWRLRPGACFVLRPKARYVGSHDPQNPLVVAACHFDFLNARGRAFHPAAEALPPLFTQIAEPSFMRALLQRLEDARRAGPKDEAAVWLAAVITELFRIERTEKTAAASEMERRIRAVAATIDRHPEKRHRVARIAETLGCTRGHFARMFTDIFGVAPQDYIVAARIAAAQALLKSSSLKISRIADLLGYGDVYFFSRQFRKKTGIPPAAFRRT